MERFIGDVKLRSHLSPSHHGRSLILTSEGPELRPLPTISVPYYSPVQSSIWLTWLVFPALVQHPECGVYIALGCVAA